MARVLILDGKLLDLTVSRLAQQLLEHHTDLKDMVIIGLQPRGVFLSERIREKIATFTGVQVPAGKLDITFFRDDFRRRDTPVAANATHIPFIIEGKRVVLIDDVLFTGRSVRAAMDAMLAYGRPEQVELLTLIDRKYQRDLPIEATYVGKAVNTLPSEKVVVEWTENGFEADSIWIVGPQQD